METSKRDIVFAKIGDKDKYIAGVDFNTVVSDIRRIYPEVSPIKVVVVEETSIPQEYQCSVRRVKEFRDWEKTGSYLLMRDFEKNVNFRRYFPNESNPHQDKIDRLRRSAGLI